MFKKIALVGLFLVVASGAIIYRYWLQFTAVPDWYQSQNNSTSQAINLQDPEAIAKVKTEINSKIQTQLQQSNPENQGNNSNYAEIELTEKDLNQLLVSQLVNKPETEAILPATKAINTSLNNDKIAIGTLINPSEIVVNDLPQSQQKIVEKTLDTFPILKNKDIYVGIEGKPIIEQGKITFDPQTKVKIGNISLTVDEVANKLGVSPDVIKNKLALEMQQMNIHDLSLDSEKIMMQIEKPQ